ncbi:glycoside hydrolase [uncultured Polaribacter sp.]|uniref:glycoside hydrolase n=1 Tax=uncultured Polaribacter sp. TaxID=174711 RepID=UPI0026039186|nr:glycoside hydrolase [uncultured Polaribacter sp.]
MSIFKVICFCVLVSCNTKTADFNITVNKNIVYQTMKGFGASDAWRCQFVGLNWPEDKKERIAELLFSKEFDENGNPKGIGLSFWRFYIGAGSTEQGRNSEIRNEWRRGESFIDADGNYDWNKQKGQQWFLNKAKSYGVDNFLAFSIAPPVQWSLNGKAYNSDLKSGSINLKADKFDDYAGFLVEFLKHFNAKGISFDYLSPINEPQWEWEKKTQEGTPATNKDILLISSLIDNYIKENNLSTKIVIAEAADLRWLYSDYGKPKRGNQIDYFFNEGVKIENLDQTITGHSYFTTWPIDSLITIRQKLHKKLVKYPNLDYWQSEFCILEKNNDIEGGRKRDLGMATALYVARVIHADLTLANANSWQWWTALTNADYKDGLIYLDTGVKKNMHNLESLKFDGNFHDSKLLWAFGNYSKFIRPGMIRVDSKLNTTLNLKEQYDNLMHSTYLNKETSELISVVINYSNEDKKVNFKNFYTDKMYVTSEDKNLEKVAVNNENIVFESRSVSTVIGHLKK